MSTGSNTPQTPTKGVHFRRKRVHPSSSTPRQVSSLRRTKTTQGDWSTDEEAEHTEELLGMPEMPRRRDQETPKLRKSTSARRRGPSGYLTLLQAVRRAVSLFFRVVLPLVAPILPYILLAAFAYVFLALIRSYTLWYLSYFPAFLHAPLSRLNSLALPLPRLRPFSPAALLRLNYSSLSGLAFSLFGGSAARRRDFELLSASAARAAKTRASDALDVFDHLIHLGDADSDGMSLEPVAIWELATAVKYTSTLEDRDFAAGQLGELGDLTREVKDAVIGLNAQGLNAFAFVLHEFDRLEDLILRASTSSKPFTSAQAAEFSDLLSSLFDKISSTLSDLLNSLDRSIPLVTIASDKSRLLFASLRSQEASSLASLEEMDWVSHLLESTGRKVGGAKRVRMLKRDIELTRVSAGGLMGVWQGLESTRESLVSYQQNVGHYKAGLVGYYLSGNTLSVNQEVASLKTVMDEMRNTLELARRRSRGGVARAKVRELGET
ncbi:proteophosphoglycan ppg4 [Rhodotorula toruloides]|uniref:Proteophosphoglycan ppg4 n=1 Tax=Rhodotorula toruloides TaxID=5286 RepID=A0A511KQJ8_RHOTO|nr:proteophosphoglycan ppg4 [Rhodotorula toruloides]